MVQNNGGENEIMMKNQRRIEIFSMEIVENKKPDCIFTFYMQLSGKEELLLTNPAK